MARVRHRSPEYMQRKRHSRRVRGLAARDERVKDRRTRAREQGVPYELHGEPPCPETCSMCGTGFDKAVPLRRAQLDRKVPALGYVPGNVGWLCQGCNGWKGRRTLAEAEAIVDDKRGPLLAAYLKAA